MFFRASKGCNPGVGEKGVLALRARTQAWQWCSGGFQAERRAVPPDLFCAQTLKTPFTPTRSIFNEGNAPLRMVVTCLATLVLLHNIKQTTVIVKWRRNCDAMYAPWFANPR